MMGRKPSAGINVCCCRCVDPMLSQKLLDRFYNNFQKCGFYARIDERKFVFKNLNIKPISTM